MNTWLLAMKPSFLSEWAALPPGDAEQVQRKLALLAQEPAPDGNTRQQLQGWDGTLCRLRWGRYRVFYTLAGPCLSLVALRRRGNDTYDEAIEAQELSDGVAAPGEEPSRDAPWHRWLTPRAHTGPTLHYLPAPITREMLDALRVPLEHQPALLGVETEDALLECASIPEHVRQRVLDALVGRPLGAAARELDLALDRVDDLLRYTRGELSGFPLRLDAEQQRFVQADDDSAGPTLLAGGPGTGKSTVALYRARAMIDRLRSAGVERPRILFATYTPALARAGAELLGSWLGADAALVDVRTAESVAPGAGPGAGPGPTTRRYDSVVIDEAQDLDPAVLQALVGLCAPERLFLTADADQSIHRAFRWSDVHERLRVTGDPGLLRTDHRATRAIREAARQYLTGAPGSAAGASSDAGARSGAHTGPVPAVRSVADSASEIALLVRFLPAAARELRLGLGACAVLCPTPQAAQRIAEGLQAAGLAAAFLAAGELDPGAPGIKTLTLHSAKGLEFPIVAVAGFGDAPYPDVPSGLDAEGRTALVQRERRTLFMAMTRATRALLVLVPAGARSELLAGFDPACWNLGEARAG
jgi:mRNA-degrading endonuclease RelE of RelBE toxin-antitoxin system